MGMFNEYPYRNLTDLNLDYIFKIMKEVEKQVEYFVSLNAIKYADPIQWDITRQYEKNTIVIDPLTGTAYISVAPVPAGTALTRPEYWTVVFDLQRFITKACKNFTSRYEAETTTTATFNTPKDGWLCWADVLYKANVNITAGDSYIPGGNITAFTIEDFGGHLDDLLTTDKSNVVAAINELVNVLLQMNIEIGDLNDLTTVDKTSIVNAINELVTEISNAINIIGDLNDLTTTDKTSVVNAINELMAGLTTTNNNIGDLNDLSTSDKSSIVNAINDIASIVPSGIGINVKDYGAVGDGVTDDSAAIQAALDVGGIIFFPDGDYVIETTLIPTDYSTLLGNNRQTARLKAKGCDAINLSNHNMVSIMNLCISPHADNIGQYTAIDLNGCNRPTIKNVLIGKFNYGIYSHTSTNWDVYLEDIYFSEPNVGLYHPDLQTQLHVIAHKCYFDSNSSSRCIDLHSTRGEFYDCRFGCRNTRAVNITDLSNLLFIGCDFEADSAITMGAAPNNAMVHIGEGYYHFLKCTFVGNDYFTAGYLLQLWNANSCQFIDSIWSGVANQYKFNIDSMYDSTVGSVYFDGIAFNPLYDYIKTNNLGIIKYIFNRYVGITEYPTRPNTTDIIPNTIYHNINSAYHEYYDGNNWEIFDHHTWTP